MAVKGSQHKTDTEFGSRNDTKVQGTILKQVEKWAISFAGEHGFQVFSPMADRHGSWEITFRRRTSCAEGQWDRLVCLAFTGLPVPIGTSPIYQVQVWAGAEMGDRFTKHLTSEFRVIDDTITTRVALTDTMAPRLERGFEVANQLTPRDLDKLHFPLSNPVL